MECDLKNFMNISSNIFSPYDLCPNCRMNQNQDIFTTFSKHSRSGYSTSFWFYLLQNEQETDDPGNKAGF